MKTVTLVVHIPFEVNDDYEPTGLETMDGDCDSLDLIGDHGLVVTDCCRGWSTEEVLVDGEHIGP